MGVVVSVMVVTLTVVMVVMVAGFVLLPPHAGVPVGMTVEVMVTVTGHNTALAVVVVVVVMVVDSHPQARPRVMPGRRLRRTASCPLLPARIAVIMNARAVVATNKVVVVVEMVVVVVVDHFPPLRPLPLLSPPCPPSATPTRH